jgi:hypothetical protein
MSASSIVSGCCGVAGVSLTGRLRTVGLTVSCRPGAVIQLDPEYFRIPDVRTRQKRLGAAPLTAETSIPARSPGSATPLRRGSSSSLKAEHFKVVTTRH